MGCYLKQTCFLLSCACLLCACKDTPVLTTNTLFTAVPAAWSGIDFVNRASYTDELNCYTFRNFYNGGGVGLGDFNNDGLTDIFFCGNMVSNRLYLNRGNFKFEDVTKAAGLGSKKVWSSGVSVADVNGDGWLDLYVCKSGPPGGPQRYNELFINNGFSHSAVTNHQSPIPTFSEKSKEYGIAAEGLSVHAAFFDYDLDSDLDLYLLNNSLRSVGGYDLVKDQRIKPDPLGGNKLYRNDGSPQAGGQGGFTDVTQSAGIYSSNIGFGLGVAVSDLNLDGWPDLYVSNDFFERDYFYLNNQDGTFREDLEGCIRETSMGSMGADIADLNNDALPDIFVTEMLPQDDRRIKTKTKFENWELYRREVENGYYHQFTRNVLQLNLGLGSAVRSPKSVVQRPQSEVQSPELPITNHQSPIFTEISRFAGVSATDWSWGALIADLDNDGWKDIYVANGIGKDLTDQDYINFYSDPDNVRAIIQKEGKAITKMVDAMPSEKIPNYAFQNQSALTQHSTLNTQHANIPTFINKAAGWGLAEPSFSNGSAYADLDNDGDLDLVVNNLDMPPFLYRNNTNTLLPKHHFLSIELKGAGKNTHALGAKVLLRSQGRTICQEVSPMRGFESTVDSRLVMGLGEMTVVDSLVVQWPGGQTTLLTNVPAGQFLKLDQRTAAAPMAVAKADGGGVFQEVSIRFPLGWQHVENLFSDFDRDRLIFQMLSAEGPKMCRADVNGDGLEDFFIGGAKDSPGALLVQKGGTFQKTNEALFEKDKSSEDTGCLFFDADGDGDADLYAASGGNEFASASSALFDRLYLNDGRGNFTKTENALPAKFSITACVAAADLDADGDLDLFTGERLQPFFYGVPCNGYIFQNDGKGKFTDVTSQAAPALRNLGMITDAVWADLDGDKDADLAICGEYMPLTIFKNEAGRLTTNDSGLTTATAGWWNCLTAADLDGDGDLDLAAGNHGLNSRFRAGAGQPVSMWINDFDQNGTAEQVVTQYEGNQAYPLALRNDLLAQMPVLKKKFLYFKDYANRTIENIFAPAQLKNALHLEASTLASAVFLNDGQGAFEMRLLPAEAQLAPVYAIAAEDFDHDGHTDLLLGGNFYRSKPEVGIYDGSYGWMLAGDGLGGFTASWPGRSGFLVKGEIRDFSVLKQRGQNLVVVARNNAAPAFFTW